MSGGRFDYIQRKMEYVAEDVIDYAEANEQEWTPETLAKFRETANLLTRAATALQRVDWLASGDDGEGSFHERWAEDFGALEGRK